ncbi:HAD family hydrolase [Micromonospora sp. NPDC093277]|uniref:HAD family hydrolase n=1 Tax=Micromonospora sp. NPDC093277 TaxID=3364291 RepID=UPI0037F30ABE
MPDHAEPTHASSRADGAPRPSTSRRPVEAVLFDFHGTLAQVEEPREWVLAAAAACGVELDRVRATALADRLLTAGRAGGPLPARVPPRLAELWADRDLYEHAHRGAYTGLAETVDVGIDGFADALYERVLVPDGWVPYPDAEAVLSTLRRAGVKVAVVSNIGFDIRPLIDAWGLTELIDAYALSYEVGRCKPDPGIFLRACGMLGVDPERALMVGDTPADAGAVGAGCAVLVLPCVDAGRPNGLGAVLDLAVPA